MKRKLLNMVRSARGTLLASAALGCLLWMSGCALVPYYNVTHFDTVVVDAGHGGRDSGASARGRRCRALEKDLTLDMALRVRAKLREAGFHTVLTRRDDRCVSLDDRVEVSNAHRDSIFVSIHFNDARRRAVHGAEVYHNGRGTWQLAGRIERNLASMSGGCDRGVHTARFRVLRKSNGPAVLVECGYLSNGTESAHCADAAWREQAACRIAQAIINQRQR